MKFEVHIDATPAEARAFLGLPDLSPVHEVWVKRLTKLAEDGPGMQDWQKMMQSWMGGMPGMDSWQKMLGAMMQSQAGKSSKDNKD